ncbi:MFS transporter [Flavihumibacter petaseus]|uniref:Putative major facilitator superfamily transporter n=1 Tax=Flavihumibacter petaseus NBRC 106054 TaxID=1220578 RepID=A0A0E9MXZ2_9BACT|nr:MFS transporter [Flavihumibacter petaseus]GAO42306.1 putative major facilitator superfamily transporter [Flavihumibacter petaseus NBRC 106054]
MKVTKINLAALFAISFLSSALGGTVSTLMSVYLPVVVRELPGESGTALNTLSAYINSIFIFGWAIGGFAWGMIGDRIGRKRALLATISTYGLFTILTGQMNHWTGIVVCRFISGFGVGGVAVLAYTMLSEVWPAKSRGIVIGILSIAFPVGIISAGLINYLVSSWREGFMVGIIPIALAVIGWFTIRESEGWLAAEAREQRGGNSFKALFTGDHRKDLVGSAVIYGTMLISLWAIFSWLPTWIQGLITGADAGADAQKARGLSMMLLGMGGLVGGFISGWIVKAMGVQRSMVIGFTTCAILSFVLFKSNSVFSQLIYLEIGVLSIFFGLNMGILAGYIPQLFPTPIRATATGFSLNVGRLFTGIAVLFVGVLVSAMGGFGNALLVFSMIFLLGLVTVLFVKPK